MRKCVQRQSWSSQKGRRLMSNSDTLYWITKGGKKLAVENANVKQVLSLADANVADSFAG